MGIQLPSIEYKVVANDASLDVTAAKAAVLGDVLQKKLEPAGQAFVKFGESGEIASVRISSATARTQADLDLLGERAKTFASGMEGNFKKGATAVIKLSEDGEAALARLGRTAETVTEDIFVPAFTDLAQVAAKLGTQIVAVASSVSNYLLPIIIGVAGAVTAALTPAIAAAAGELALLAEGFGVFGGFGVLAGGVVALATATHGWANASANLAAAQNQLRTAQDAVANSARPTKAQLDAVAQAQRAVNDATKAADNPFTKLTTHLDKVGHALGDQVAPAAAQILTFLDGLVDPIAKVGSNLATWFGDRLPKVLVIAQDLFDSLGGAGKRLAAVLGPMFDKLISDPTKFEQTFDKVANAVVDAILGLMKHLDDLATWFEGPQGQHMLSQAGAIMDGIGSAVNFAITVVGDLAIGMSVLGDALDRLGAKAHAAGDAIRSIPAVGGLAGDALGVLGKVNVGRASGGPVMPGSIYTVGEQGPETLVMGRNGGGVVIPNSGGGGGPNMRNSERLLEDVRALLQVIAGNTKPESSGFSNRAYGRS